MKATADLFKATRATTKDRLPLISLCVYKEGATRGAAGVSYYTGVPIDADSGAIKYQEAFDALKKAGIRCLIYETPSSTNEDKFRILLPLSEGKELDRAGLSALIFKVHQLLGCPFAASESAAEAQAFYIGSVDGKDPRMDLINPDDGIYIDQFEIEVDLSNCFFVNLGKHTGTKIRSDAPWREQVTEGVNLHDSSLMGAWELIREGKDDAEVTQLLISAFEESPCYRDDSRWADRIADIPRSVSSKRDAYTGTTTEATDLARREDPRTTFADTAGLREDLDKLREDTEARAERKRKQIAEAKLVGEGVVRAPRAEVLTPDQMLERFVFIGQKSQVYDRKNRRAILNQADARGVFAASRVQESHRPPKFAPNGEEIKRNTPAFEKWLGNTKRLSVNAVTFRAGAHEFTSNPDGQLCVNTWAGYFRPTSVEPSPEAGLFFDHIRWLFGDRADEFIDWLAHIEQKPGELPHRGWLHVADKTGTGRNFIADVLARLWSGYVAVGLSPDVLFKSGGFNGELGGKVLGVIDEVRIRGGGQYAAFEQAKKEIVTSTRTINNKYGMQYTEHNAMRVLMFSNHRDAVPIDAEDRRIEIALCTATPHPEDYYTRLYGLRKVPGFLMGVARILQDRDISKFSPGAHAKWTDAKSSMVQYGAGESLTHLLDFTKHYPLPFVTSRRLTEVTGIENFGPQQRYFSQTSLDAGWVKFPKLIVLPEGRVRVYHRKEIDVSNLLKYGNHTAEIKKRLPLSDGGESTEWTPDPVGPVPEDLR